MRAIALTVLVPLLHACGGGNDSDLRPDANPAVPDAAPLSCSDRMPLTIGHCIDTETDEPCLNFESEGREFLSIAEQATIPPIVGLQGSPMFVLAVWGDDIAQGENEDAALIDLQVSTQADEFVGGYNSRPRMIVDPQNEQSIIAPQLYVVSFFADEQEGLEVRVRAEVEDRLGQQYCAEESFTIGALIDGPGEPI